MAPRARQKLPVEIEALAKRLDAYRKQRQRRRCLPESIWNQAAELARRHGVFRVQEALRLNYCVLKRRMEALASPSPEVVRALPIKQSPAFVELSVPPLASGGTILELEDRTGRKLTVRLAGENGVELVELARVLWGSPQCSN